MQQHREITLKDQNVIIRDGKSDTMGDSEDVSIPDNALLIEG